MITLREARQIVMKTLGRDTQIKSAILYGHEYLFLAHGSDPIEGEYDPFIKVNADTGELSDFSPQDYDSPGDVLSKLNPR